MKPARSGRKRQAPIRPGEDNRVKWVTVSFPDYPSHDLAILPVNKLVSKLDQDCTPVDKSISNPARTLKIKSEIKNRFEGLIKAFIQ